MNTNSPPGRPDCFEFAMEFLGSPESGAVRAYVEHLERALASLSTCAADVVKIAAAAQEGEAAARRAADAIVPADVVAAIRRAQDRLRSDAAKLGKQLAIPDAMKLHEDVQLLHGAALLIQTRRRSTT